MSTTMKINVTPMPENGTYMLNMAVYIEGIYIPMGFEWNGASIPRFLWPILGSPFAPEMMVASLVHDYLYSKVSAGYIISRREADKIFRKLLMANGMDEETAETLYTGVRVGGRSHYQT
jgi:hypothetical protein